MSEKYLPFPLNSHSNILYIFSDDANTTIHLLSLNFSCQIIIFRVCVRSPIFRFFTKTSISRDSVGDLSERIVSNACVKSELLHGVSRRAKRSWKTGADGYEDLHDVDKQLQTERGIIALSFPSLQAYRSSLLEEDPLSRHYASKPGLPVCFVASNSVL